MCKYLLGKPVSLYSIILHEYTLKSTHELTGEIHQENKQSTNEEFEAYDCN